MMATFGIGYKEVMWGVPWPVLLRMIADQPRQIKKGKKDGEKVETKKLGEASKEDIANFFARANKNAK